MSTTIRETAPGVFDIRIRPGRHLKPHWFRVRGTRAEAELQAARAARQIAKAPPTVTRNDTLGAWLRLWLANAHDLSPRTRATYQTHIDAWIDPDRPGWTIGAMRLRDITEADGGAFLAWMQDGCGCRTYKRCRCPGGFRQSLKPRTYRDSIVLIRSALARAVQRGILLDNPWEHVKLPRAARRPPATPGRDDIGRLAECPDPRVRLLLLLAAYTGARRSELLGLTWEHIDLKGGNLTIGASLDHQRGQLPTLKEPKTGAGRRTIALPSKAVSELRHARLAAPALSPHASRRIEARPVFANDDGSWWTPEAASQAAKRALEALGLPGSLHTLRHAHATLLLGGEAKISPHIVSRRLGHASVATTLELYAHAIPADDDAAAKAMDRIFARPRVRFSEAE